MAQIKELEGLEQAFKFGTTFRNQIEFKSSVYAAQLVFEVARDVIPEYIDYMDRLEEYKQSKLEHQEAREQFIETIRRFYNKNIESIQ